MHALTTVAILASCYLVGSVPFGYLLARARGVDIREQGSRNIGATNVSRVLGRRLGALVLVLDALKGLGPTLLAGGVMSRIAPRGEAAHYALWLAAALSCIVGHICPVYLRFRGGKGVATGLGATLGIFPETMAPCAVGLVVWLAATWSTGYVSVGSVAAALSLPLTMILTLRPLDLTRHWPLLLYTVLLAALVVLRHRANLARLRAGTEPKIGHGPGG